ncbi:sugar phosphate isomerase/epimerase [Bacillaceae bacterium SIJ1]|uniref:sugar phosphate isomerase/epimerase family protein n=1 Tax=Litoribacterium kuwaitense TaxID=1398745 RepID=UPI0013ED41F4|nr:sugar phosphate isomerase/epimerase [Litoribacterium kuwaitense]NGP43939.1 sugar phosphate isomerase/epimerase [Litoribacterium kuwaitense]
MKLGVFTVLYQDLAFEDMLDKVKAMGIEAVEVGTGAYPGQAHAPLEDLLADDAKVKAFQEAITSRGLTLSGLSFHGNPLHPDPEFAKKSHESWRNTVLLAEKLGLDVVNGFSGCPGDSETSKNPNWVTCAWPPEYAEVLEWQWTEKVIPYWQEEAAFAKEHGIQKIAFEMHPGFVVYNPETLLRLRAAVGDIIGANFDPSHLVWQGIDPVEAIKHLGKENAIFHFHAKDVYVDEANKSINGVLDTKHYGQVLDRSWTFRTCGYGQNEKLWRDMISALQMVNYDYVMSIEHEDMLASIDEGLQSAIDFLKPLLFTEKPAEAWWA